MAGFPESQVRACQQLKRGGSHIALTCGALKIMGQDRGNLSSLRIAVCDMVLGMTRDMKHAR